jgi:hypothetical protein
MFQAPLFAQMAVRDGRAVIQGIDEMATLSPDSRLLAILCTIRDQLQEDWRMAGICRVFDINKRIFHPVRHREMLDLKSHISFPGPARSNQEFPFI